MKQGNGVEYAGRGRKGGSSIQEARSKMRAKIAESKIPLRENKYYRAIAPPSGRGADEEKGA